MVHACCIFKCSNRATKDSNLNFHSFPSRTSDKERFDKWTRAVNRQTESGNLWMPSPEGHDKICSEHFVDSDYKEGTKIKILKKTAVPSIFPGRPVIAQIPQSPDIRSESPDPQNSTIDHSYAFVSEENHVEKLKDKINSLEQNLKKCRAEIKSLKKKLIRKTMELESRKRTAPNDIQFRGAKKKCERSDDGDSSRCSPSTTSSTTQGLFQGIVAYILHAGIEKKRYEIFTSQVQKNGGSLCKEYTDNSGITHIIVGDKMDPDRFLRLMHLTVAPNAQVVKSAWLSTCLRKKSFLPCDDHLLHFPMQEKQSSSLSDGAYEAEKEVCSGISSNKRKTNDNHTSSASSAKSHRTTDSEDESIESERSETVSDKFHKLVPTNEDSDSDYVASDEEFKTDGASIEAFSLSLSKLLPIEKWICGQSSKNLKTNVNSHITEKLEEMVKTYESTNDKWRAFGYQKAIQALKRHPNKITTAEEAVSLPGVGKRLASKIQEIVDSGQLRKLQELKSSEEVRTMELFTNVWGAGPTTAHQWYQQGFRTIEDLKEKAHLSHQQKVGVRLYHDLLDRMPREEAGQIEQVVREAAESLQPGIVAQACGSYRRGKATCGDVDVLVTHPDGKSHRGIFSKLLAKLKKSGFLTDDLVSADEAGNQKKYLGVCKLPGDDRKHRRLDIIVVPFNEYGCALVYFTGSAHFNRSLRHLCKKQNMSLNEHALKSGVVRKGAEKIYEGTVVPTPTEESVFAALKVPYRSPEERDH